MKYGQEIINFDGKFIPTLLFGGGNIRVTNVSIDSDSSFGVLFSIVELSKPIGTTFDKNLVNENVENIENINSLLSFDNVKSVDVLIGALENIKLKLEEANK